MSRPSSNLTVSRRVGGAAHRLRRPLGRSALAGAVFAALLVLGLVAATSSFAVSYEEVGTFAGILTPPVEPEVFPEEVQLGGVSAMAVNSTGAGSVTPGTLYAATTINGGGAGSRIVRYEPEPNGHMKFVESWGIRSEGFGEQCGPFFHTECPTRVTGEGGSGVSVDQATGNVYALTGTATPGKPMVTEYSPDGTEVIARFAVLAEPNEPLAASPEKRHTGVIGGIAVNDTGVVYVFDLSEVDNHYHRLMRFEPQTPGDYAHYVYAGREHDVAAGINGEGYPTNPVLDDAGNIYTAEAEKIEEWSPGSSKTAVCHFTEPKDGISAMNVEPETGEVFYYSYKDKEVHRLSACNGKGEFVPEESITVKPERGVLKALVFDPDRQLPPRLPGVLYGATPTGAPPTGGKGEPHQSSLGYIFAPVEENSPIVESEQVSGVSETAAELQAAINPKGSTTSYVFQYLTAEAFAGNEESFTGAIEAPLGAAVLGNGQETLIATFTAAGLDPNTEYKYRVIATSHCAPSEPAKLCETVGSVQGFRTFPSAVNGLADHRAYELVSPIEKFGGQVFPSDPFRLTCPFRECKPGALTVHFPMQASPDGEAIVYEGTAFSSDQGAAIENEYISHRTGADWQTTDLTPPLLGGAATGYRAFDSNLNTGLIEQVYPSLSASAPSEFANIYSQPTGAPTTLTPLLTEAPPNRSPLGSFNHLMMQYAGASSDLSRVFFEANDALTGETPFAPAAVDGGAAKQNLYESTAGGIRLVNVAPGNTATMAGAIFGRPAEDKGEFFLNDLSHAISDDGSRAFWSSEAGQLYVRENGERTVEIPDHTGKFLTAAADGSKVLLDDGHIYGELENEVPTEQADLTAGKGGFQGILGQSEDLSWVYFVDTAVLNEQANDQGAVAQESQDNLYVWHEGATAFVATLASTDSAKNQGGPGDWRPSPAQRSAEASPDGKWVTFLSRARLTGYDNTGPCEILPGGKFRDATCAEVLLYNASSGELKCVSCDRSGARPLGASALTVSEPTVGSHLQPRYLTDSGRLYFDSQNSLTPADTNHGVEDVYEFEPDGSGTCASTEGCVSLISAGTGDVDSNLLAVDENGKNVFFTTRDQLVTADKDELIDLYDAREGGGLQSQSETTPPGCLGEGCQGAAATPPAEAAAGTLSFSGEGNLVSSLGAPSVKPKPKPLTRAQLLTRALKQCKKKPHKKRIACERAARKKYGAKKASKSKGVGR